MHDQSIYFKVDKNGKLVARIHQQSESSSAPGEQPREMVTTKLDIPGEGIHQTMVQNLPSEGQKEAAIKVSAFGDKRDMD